MPPKLPLPQVLAVCLLAFGIGPKTVALSDEMDRAVQQAAATAAPGVVRIQIIGNSGAEDLSVSSQVTTGVSITDDGEILTSMFGFTSAPAAIFVEDATGQKVAARIVARDHIKKLVLLKCDGGQFFVPSMATATWPEVGEWSVAMGRFYPGAEPALSVGIVSAVQRIHGLAIQSDAKISPVNYGGPLVNLDGTITGILVPLSPQDSGNAITAGVEWYDSGIGFAIPIRHALEAARILRTGDDRVRGIIGIRPSTRNPLEEDFFVQDVHSGSPAERAELKPGDRIVAANGVAISRFGEFDSIAKSMYAGQDLQLEIQRNEERLSLTLTLAAEISRSRSGYLGIVVQDAVQIEGDETAGVRVLTIPDSPASESGFPTRTIVTKIDGQAVDSTDALRSHLGSIVVGQKLELTCRADPTSSDEQNLTLTASEKPNTVMSQSADFASQASPLPADTEWERAEEPLKETGGSVWFLAPNAPEGVKSGLVVLLSESDTVPAAVLQKWEAVCRQYNLILAVPVNDEKTGLTREHHGLVRAAISSILPKHGIDVRRIVLVARSGQADLASELYLSPRLRQIRSAVFLAARPALTGVPGQLLSAKSPATLILTDSIQSRQSRALMDQAAMTLNRSGAWTVVSSMEAENQMTAERIIGNWTITLMAD